MNIKSRQIGFDLLKIISCISVIIIHMSAYVLNTISVDTLQYKIASSYAGVVHFSVGVFVMITGAFLLSRDEMSKKKIFKHYILKVGLIYIITSMIYKIFYYNGGDLNNLSINIIFGMFIRTLAGSSHLHLWYLYMLLGLYLIYPLIYKLVRKSNKEELKYTLIVLLFLSSILFSINELLGLLKLDFRISTELKLSIYIFYFIAGFYLYKYNLSKRKSILLISLIPISSIFTIILSNIRALQIKAFSLNFINYESINIVLSALGMFYLFKLINKKIKFSENISKIVYFLSKETLGIYLIHLLVMDYIYKKNIINFNLIGNVLLIPIYSIVVFSICFIIVYFVKYLCKVVKKIIVN